jgi:hypothetical protein
LLGIPDEDLHDRVHGSMELDNDDGSSSGGSGLSDLSNDDVRQEFIFDLSLHS